MQSHMKVVHLAFFAVVFLFECRSHAEYTPVQQLRLSSMAPTQYDKSLSYVHCQQTGFAPSKLSITDDVYEDDVR